MAGGFFTTSTTWKGRVWFTAMDRRKTQGLEVGKSRFMALQLGSRGCLHCAVCLSFSTDKLDARLMMFISEVPRT